MLLTEEVVEVFSGRNDVRSGRARRHRSAYLSIIAQTPFAISVSNVVKLILA